MLLDEFKKSCIELKPDEVVERYLIEQPSYFFKEIQKGKEYEFKKDIANMLKVHIRDIVIVGSGKLGFSMKPDDSATGLYSFAIFDSKRESDLDIAIVSSSLFDSQMKNLYNHTVIEKFNVSSWKDISNFRKYMLRGRLVIRFLPDEFGFTESIKAVQDKYQMNYGREINLEIYKSWYYFETYHQKNVRNIHINLIK